MISSIEKKKKKKLDGTNIIERKKHSFEFRFVPSPVDISIF